jgi:Uma2 family endonuclease
MMPVVLVSVEEYLNTDYSPDCDYVDGLLEDRNVGQKDHSTTQMKIAYFLYHRRHQLNISVFPEQRVQVSTSRVGVPDVCVTLGEAPNEQVFTRAPFLCIEILSPDDRMSRMQEKMRDYLGMGVRYLWLIDPYTGLAWIHTSAGAVEAKDGVLRTTDPVIEMPLAEVLPA